MNNIERKNFKIKESDKNEYSSHIVFNTLERIRDFYKDFSFLVIGYLNSQTNMIVNFDSYIYSSMEGTIESIATILKKGRIGDAFALLRKLHDKAILNIYINLYIEKNIKDDKWEVIEITKWLKGKDKLPHNTYGRMSEYIENSKELEFIFKKMMESESYLSVRARGNDHVHSNYFHNLLNNDNTILSENRLSLLSSFKDDLENIFILHLSCIFTIKEHYMSSTDYIDALEVGVAPEEGSQYWVAENVQSIFKDFIQAKQPDIADFIKNSTCMNLQS